MVKNSAWPSGLYPVAKWTDHNPHTSNRYNCILHRASSDMLPYFRCGINRPKFENTELKPLCPTSKRAWHNIEYENQHLALCLMRRNKQKKTFVRILFICMQDQSIHVYPKQESNVQKWG